MGRMLLLVGCLFLAVPLGGLAQQRSAAVADSNESRLALVIGNASYKDAPLANPVNDARAIAKTLDESGFSVKLLVNLTQAQMRRAIREFGDELHAKQGVGLFYFAGHGVQLSNRNFLIPVGADIQREYEVEDQAVDAGAVLSMMQSAKARVNIVILDACRNNPFIRDFRSTINGLAPMQAPAGTLVAFSTAPGQTAIDGTGQFGLYTEHLVGNLPIPGLKIEDVFKNVRIGVQRASGGRQVPWENTSLTGDFYFRAPTATATSASAAGTSAAEIQRAVQAALKERDAEESARRKTQQDDIERAVQAALAKREQDLAAAQAARAERDSQASQAAVEALKKELTELRAAREAEQKPAVRVAARETAPQESAQPQPVARTTAAVTGPLQPTAAQVALAAPSARTQPTVNVGARIERPEIRVGDQWKYQVTDRFTNLKEQAVIEVATVTENRIYTRSARVSMAALGNTWASGAIDVWDRDWNLHRRGDTEYAPFYPSLQFPLEPGKTWSGTVNYYVGAGASLVHQVTAQVIGWERVTVPAGTFDAVKISVRGYYRAAGAGSGLGSVDNVVWYAPAVRQFVKKDIQERAGIAAAAGVEGHVAANNQQYERWELVEYKPN